MKKTMMIRVIAIMLVIVLMGGLLSGCGKTGDKNDSTEITPTGTEQKGGDVTDPTATITPSPVPEGYCRVTFSLPENASENEKYNTMLPEEAIVPAGTAINTLAVPTRFSSMFLGWSYDEAGKELVGESDVVDRDVTLYPRFVLKDGMQDGGALSYVARTDVATNYAFELVSYGLTAEQVRNLLMLEDASFGTENLPFTLVSVRETEEKAWMTSIGIDAATAEKIWALVEQEEQKPSSNSFGTALLKTDKSGALELPITTDQRVKLVARFAPAELQDSSYQGLTDENGNPISVDELMENINYEELDAVTKAILESMDINLATATEDELKAYFGLEEDDSLQRFWREDLHLDVEQVRYLEDALLHREIVGEHWLVTAESGEWDGGTLYSLTIKDTTKLRFYYDDKVTDDVVTEYNIKVHLDQIENISVDPEVHHVSADKVEGVEFIGIFDLETDENGDFIAKENYGKGELTYSGSDKLKIGEVIAVNKGSVNSKGFTDDDVAYVKITKDLGNGKYEYARAGLEDIVALPDVLPVPDDGSIDDGVIELTAADVNFGQAAYKEYQLTADTTVDVGDALVFFKGTLGKKDFSAVGYGTVTQVTAKDGGLTVKYEVISEKKMYGDENLMYKEMPEVEFTVTETDAKQLEEEMRAQVMNSGIIDETGGFLTALVLGQETDIDSLEHAEEIRNMTIKTEDGDITLDDLRMLADGAEKVKVSDIKVTALLGTDLNHFKGKKGIRGEIGVSFTIEISIMDAGILEIQPAIVFEQEFLINPTIRVVRHKNRLGLTSSLDVTASLQAGTYSGFGISVTAKTKNNPNPNADKDWAEMVNNYVADNSGAEGDQAKRDAKQKAASILNKVGQKFIDKTEKDKNKGQGQGYENQGGEEKKGKDSKQDFVSPGVGGDLPTKYSGMLSNDAQYINLINKEVAGMDFPVDPMGIVHCGLKINFVVALKINAAIGAGVMYANAKEYSFSFRAKIWGGGPEEKEQSIGRRGSVKDVETPNFRADFYAFGMVGVKIGVALDLRVGLFSTDLDSVGVVATAGLYAELYGFLYCWYEWTSGQGSTSGAMGSLLFEIGIYADISVKVQVGVGKASKSWSLYSKKTPLIQLGCKEYPIDFVIKKNSEKLSVTIKDGEDTVKVPDDVYKIKMMALNSGKIAEKSMDSKKVCEEDAKPYTVTTSTIGYYKDDKTGEDIPVVLTSTRSWTQYNEDHFVVECFDTDKDGNVKQGPSSFQYLPATNEIYICPVEDTDEVWGKVVFSYKNNAFGFSTETLQREVKVHWKGTRQTAKVEYLLQEDANNYTKWEVVGTGSVSGYDGIRCYVQIDSAITDRYPGYKLYHLKYPDESELRRRLETLSRELKAAESNGRTIAYENNRVQGDKKASQAEKDEWAKKNKEAGQRVATLDAEVKAISRLLTEFEKTNKEAVEKGSGATWFTMRGKETVIQILYTKQERRICWDIVGDDLTVLGFHGSLYSSEWTMKPGTTERKYHTGQQKVLVGQPLMNFMPDDIKNYRKDTYTTEWYMYRFEDPGRSEYTWTIAASDALAEAMQALKNPNSENAKRLSKVTKDTLVPDGYVVVFGVQTPKQYNILWKNGDTVVRTTKQAVDSNITIPKDLIPEMDGMEFSHWETEDGKVVSAEMIMPGHDITYTAAFQGKSHTVTWILSDTESVTTTLRVGEMLYQAIPDMVYRENYQAIMRFGKAEDSEEIPPEFEMPDKDLTVYVRYTLGFATITWVEDGKTVRTNIVEIGTTPVAPTLKDREGEVLVWMIDGKVMDVHYVMPSQDVVATAFWHVHDWTGESVTIEATCARTGLAGYTCALCGMIKDGVELPINPENHKWTSIVLETSTCSTHGDKLYRCEWCHAEYHEELPLDPNVHTGTFHIENKVSPTCVKEGYDGDSVCDDCGAIVYPGNSIPPTGEHLSDNHRVTIKESTCVEHGITACHCQDCGIAMEEVELPISEYVHDWGEEEIIKEPTCDFGLSRHTCKLCGKTEEITLATVRMHEWVCTSLTNGSCVRDTVGHFTCNGCGATKDEPVPHGSDKNNHEHLGDAEVVKSPTCFEDGVQRRQCLDCGEYVEEAIPALGCEWGDVVYFWSENNLKVTATLPCLRDSQHNIVEEVYTSKQVTKKATCTEDGTVVYTTRAFSGDSFTRQTKTVTVKATGHNWGEVTYTWSDDNSTVTATRVCANDPDHIETETVGVVSEVTKKATVTEKGETTFTAEFTNKAFATQKKTIADIEALDPDWGEVTVELSEDCSKMTATRVSRTDASVVETETVAAVLQGDVKPDCENDVEFTYAAEFENEAFGTRTKTVVVKATGHDWYDDAEKSYLPKQIFEDGCCIGWETGLAVKSCRNNSEHTQTEVIKVPVAFFAEGEDITRTVANGVTTITIDFEKWYKAVGVSLGEVYGDEYTVEDLLQDWVQTVAHYETLDQANPGWYLPGYEDAEFAGANAYHIIGSIQVADADQAGYKLADATKGGSMTVTFTFTPDDSKLANVYEFEKTKVVLIWPTVKEKEPEHECEWGEVSYTWLNDYTLIEAKRTCLTDPSHFETETKVTNATKTKEPTVLEMGETTYTAKFDNEAFGEKSITVANIAKLEPEWSEVKYEWLDGHAKARASRSCINESSLDQTETVTVNAEVTKEPTVREMGQTTYTAEFVNPAFEKMEETLTDIAKKDPVWGDVELSLNNDRSKMTAKRTSTVDPTFSESETAAATFVKNTATCEAAGKATYKATFVSEVFGTRTMEIDTEALGHDWDLDEENSSEPYQEFDEDGCCCGWKAGKNVYYCKNDNGHTNTETVKAEVALVTEVEWISRTDVVEDGVTVTKMTMELAKKCENYDMTIEEILGEETVEDFVPLFAVAHHKSIDEDHPDWYLGEDMDEFYAVHCYYPKGKVYVEDDELACTKMIDVYAAAADGKITFTVNFEFDDPGDKEIFEVTPVEMTIVFPTETD